MPIWSPTRLKEELQDSHKPVQNVDPLKDKYQSEGNYYTQHFQKFINNNLPKDFQEKVAKTRPYIFTSFVAWPMYWLYRGLEWGHNRGNYRLPVYIHKTYLQAKFIQFAIIMTGIVVASMDSKRDKPTLLKNTTRNEIKKDDF